MLRLPFLVPYRRAAVAIAIVALALTAADATRSAAAETVTPDSGRFGEHKVLNGESFVGEDGKTIRIENIDAPSIRRARCPHERDLAKKTVARLTELLQTCSPIIDPRFQDAEGRMNARVSVCGEDLGSKLIDEGLASLRDVGRNWCEGLITVTDADTFMNKDGTTIRVTNIDAPSFYKAKCSAERELADKAATRVSQLLQQCPPVIEGGSRDKFGRLDAHVIVCGEDLGEKLISEGLAKERGYKGWCG